jgi:glycosyltransferase involved in cell wall biosynthesis
LSRKPLISIITPVFNQRLYIEHTIRSVLGQTCREWEWILLDDGSTDGTGEIIRDFSDSRIRYVCQEHAGLANLTKTYNRALSMCTGDFIAMLDHDDYWPAYKLDLQIKKFADPAVVLSYGVCCVVNQKGKEICHTVFPESPGAAFNNPIGSAFEELLFVRYSFILNSTVMLRRSAMKTIGGFVEAEGLYHDFPTWVRLSLEGKFSPVPLCIGFHRKHPSAVTVNSDKKRYFTTRVSFLRKFVLENEKKLHDLGLFYETDTLEKRWEEIRKEHFLYIHYDRAMLMLSLGIMGEAKAAFRVFLEKNPSMKNNLIYFLINLSALTGTDLVNPTAGLKKRIEDFFRRNC